MKVLLLTSLLVGSVVTASGQTVDERITRVIHSLEPDNTLRISLERGVRDDGIHHRWMNAIKAHGIKQVALIVKFGWSDGVSSLKVSRVTYLTDYYRYNASIRESNVLKCIRASGLERDLRAAIIERANKALPALMKNVAQTGGVRPPRARGTLYLNLLDDEALPVLDEMPIVDW